MAGEWRVRWWSALQLSERRLAKLLSEVGDRRSEVGCPHRDKFGFEDQKLNKFHVFCGGGLNFCDFANRLLLVTIKVVPGQEV